MSDLATVPQSDVHLAPASGGSLDLSSTDSLLGLFNPRDVDAAILKSGWTVEEEVSILAMVARGEGWREAGYVEPPSPATRLAAIRELRQRGLDALELTGAVATVSEKRVSSGDATVTTKECTATQLLPRLQETRRLLEQGALSRDVINVGGTPNGIESEAPVA